MSDKNDSVKVFEPKDIIEFTWSGAEFLIRESEPGKAAVYIRTKDVHNTSYWMFQSSDIRNTKAEFHAAFIEAVRGAWNSAAE
jgi:hypothetical protein